ncbi:hypothetical protein RHGRI_021688 [Rhododendron griersonianum]|uniref:Retrotransposon Copia-like N-terminal domain-containing protein n=1 Tax=Rhododendron griersonianum TaxID=479676 RepID=A0AAV6JQL0_9ERIC|nr:hypothetical protein RHGRI_021688 [Rhododendron griersonianum]
MADLSSSSSSSVAIPENLKLLISNLSSLVTVKLDPTNFIIWRKQIQNILQATYLFGYLDGTIACPSPIIKDQNGKDIVNTEFMQWKIIDSHLLSCVTATLTTPVFSLVLDLSSSREEIADQLAIASCPIQDEDLVFHILHGLPSSYDAFNTSIRTRSESITVDELTSLLCSESIHMNSHTKVSPTSGDLAVAFATNVSGSTNSSSSFSGSRGSNSMFRGRYSSRPGNRGGRYPFRGGGRGFGRNFRSPNFTGFSGASTSSGSGSLSETGSVVCQICNKPYHTALTCWYRMDSTFQPSPPIAQPATRAFVVSTSTTPPSDCHEFLHNDTLSSLQISSPIESPQAHFTQTGRGRGFHNRGRGRGYHNSSGHRHPPHATGSSSATGILSLPPNATRIHCQICGRTNHTAAQCYDRFNQRVNYPSAHYTTVD